MPGESEEERFAADVLSCARDLQTVLPGLTERHGELATVAAMIEHIGCGLRILTRRGFCTEEQARGVLRQLEQSTRTGGYSRP